MTHSDITTQRQCELVDGILRLAGDCRSQEEDLLQRDARQTAAAEARFAAALSELQAAGQRERSALVAAYKSAREAVFCRYESAGAALFEEEARATEAAAQEHVEALEVGKNVAQHRSRQIQAAYKVDSQVPKRDFALFKRQCEVRGAELEALVAETRATVAHRCPWPEDQSRAEEPPADLTAAEYFERSAAAMSRAFDRQTALHNDSAARFVHDGWPVLIFLAVCVLAVWPAWLLVRPFGWAAAVAGAACSALALALVARMVVLRIARRRALRVIPDFQQAVAEARVELQAAVRAAHAEGERKYHQLRDQRDADLAAEKQRWKEGQEQQEAAHAARLAQLARDIGARRAALEDLHERQFHKLEEEYPPRIARLDQALAQRLAELDESHHRELQAERAHLEQEWRDLAARWSAGLAEFTSAVDAMNDYCDRRFPPWDQVAPASAAGHDEPLAALRLGRCRLRIPGAILPQSERLPRPAQEFTLPAVLSYPRCPSLLLEADNAGRAAATDVLQATMLRLLTTFPPGKVRFTILDPVGLGQNFSAFMHLADFDERLVHNRIWTEATHVNQRLADLTEHMENVIQKYLRNEFASIQDYNATAGEVAEPYQILVVANFPANFSDDSARRLASIAASGARCGVYTLISTDSKQKLPRNFDLEDLRAASASFEWDDAAGRFRFRAPELEPLPLEFEPPPADERFTELVKAVGSLAKDAARVEVPFASVLPAAEDWWTADSRREIEVPLGRAGAKKLQHLRLGKGTSQHVLIAGKTGSGKSTLLNALITNLAAHYSPHELHFYLIDFKKGVEFKAYASLGLPHARVIAIESEREFGMSVLERLDGELKRRGDLFRQAGVQDLAGYRNANETAVMPRMLLVIDEFQEFFTSDDKIAHDAGLLLDRLVRQGRAFGIHVLLGSQTLAGSYSLARSTLGQMAVRIALQCSESDAHLILSEDNTAARLLNRPGEAIYNDANGLLEGNHPFQVVWLADHQREHYLRQIAELAHSRGLTLPPPTIFEGNVAADPRTNPLLLESLQAPVPAERPSAPRAWLGAAVAIKDPTAAAFARGTGNNLLIVGQQPELALGMLFAAVAGLAAQIRPGVGPLGTFVVLDSAHPDSLEAGFWTRARDTGAFDLHVASQRDAAQVVRDLAAEVERRLAAGESSGEPIFVVIYNLGRFRDLRKSDDYSFSLDDTPAAGAAKQLTTLLREGPGVGVHALVWCDGYATLNRWLDRQSLRDFDQRVLLQMSAADSSQLMDSPAASKLGQQLAFYYSEEAGRSEKFRPYAAPSPEWLAQAAELLRRRPGASANEAPAGLGARE